MYNCLMARAGKSARKRSIWGRILQARADLASARANSETLVELTHGLAGAVADLQIEFTELRAEVEQLSSQKPLFPGTRRRPPASRRDDQANPAQKGSFSFMVAGAGRGGTSLLAAVLDANPQLEVHLEFATLILYEEGMTQYGRGPERISAWRAACESEAAGSPGLHWGNKVTTEQISGLTKAEGPFRLDIGVVEAFYEQLSDIPTVFIIRDGRTCVRSKMSRSGLTLAEAASAWQLSARVYRQFREGKLNGMAVRFEDLVREPEPTLQGICRFLGVPFDAAMIEGTDNPEMLPEYRRSFIDASVLSLDGVPDGTMDLIAQDLEDCGYI